jgi:prolyl oligopeptidase
VLLYGYGGFNISLTPSFRLSIIPFLDAGGVFCVANLRGGGEYGEKWHEAGMKHNKQNVFDDFISAAEYLIKENYTQPQFIGIQGGSNGGLLIGACMTQRPDLFKVALPAVGVMDMLRFHKFTIGWAWMNEYGSPDNEDDFHYLLKYSPYHNIQCDVEYPATLVTTADHDDRVVPAHSYKFIARLQACQTGENPVLIRIETNAGHGAGKPTSKQIDEITDVMSFLMYNLKMEYHDSY